MLNEDEYKRRLKLYAKVVLLCREARSEIGYPATRLAPLMQTTAAHIYKFENMRKIARFDFFHRYVTSCGYRIVFRKRVNVPADTPSRSNSVPNHSCDIKVDSIGTILKATRLAVMGDRSVSKIANDTNCRRCSIYGIEKSVNISMLTLLRYLDFLGFDLLIEKV